MGVYNPGTYTLDGINYSGYTTVCALTNATGTSLPLASCPTSINKTFHKPTWTLAIDHDLFDKTLVYFTMRSGYRSGAINSGTFNPLVTVAQPEEVIDYETGVKSDWIAVRHAGPHQFRRLSDRLSQSSDSGRTLPNITLATGPSGVAGTCTQALFNANQCTTPTNALNNVTFNVAAARVYGVEWDITVLPIPTLTLNFVGQLSGCPLYQFHLTPRRRVISCRRAIAAPIFPARRSRRRAGRPMSPAPIPSERRASAISRSAISQFTAHYYWQSRYPGGSGALRQWRGQQTRLRDCSICNSGWPISANPART